MTQDFSQLTQQPLHNSPVTYCAKSNSSFLSLLLYLSNSARYICLALVLVVWMLTPGDSPRTICQRWQETVLLIEQTKSPVVIPPHQCSSYVHIDNDLLPFSFSWQHQHDRDDTTWPPQKPYCITWCQQTINNQATTKQEIKNQQKINKPSTQNQQNINKQST